MDNATEVVPPFKTPAELLHHILGSPRVVAVNVRVPDVRAVYPSPVLDGELDNLIRQHLTGDLKPRECLRKDGSSFNETRHFSYGAYLVRRQTDGSCVVPALIFDVDGPDHAAGGTAEKVLGLALAIYRRLELAGLQPVLEHSHGGAGFHMWVLFNAPVPAGFALALGELTLADVPDTAGVEIFPKQANVVEGKRGCAIALPLNGRKISEKGGCFIWPDLSPREVKSIRLVDIVLLQSCMALWQQFDAAQSRIKAAKKAKADFNRLLYGGIRGPDDFSDVGLEIVCWQLGEVTDDGEEEEDILKLNCPRHRSGGRKSLHVNVTERWWRCCACGDSGAGEVAEFSLAKWILVDVDEEHVRQRLNDIRTQKKGD